MSILNATTIQSLTLNELEGLAGLGSEFARSVEDEEKALWGWESTIHDARGESASQEEFISWFDSMVEWEKEVKWKRQLLGELEDELWIRRKWLATIVERGNPFAPFTDDDIPF